MIKMRQVTSYLTVERSARRSGIDHELHHHTYSKPYGIFIRLKHLKHLDGSTILVLVCTYSTVVWPELGPLEAP